MLLKLQLSIVMGLETTVKAFHAELVSQAKPYQKQLHYSEFLLILNYQPSLYPYLAQSPNQNPMQQYIVYSEDIISGQLDPYQLHLVLLNIKLNMGHSGEASYSSHYTKTDEWQLFRTLTTGRS